MQWTIAGKVLDEQTVYQKLEELRQDGPTGILLVGADGAFKGQIVSKLWNNLAGVTNLHPEGGAGPDLSNGYFVVHNPYGSLAVEHQRRERYIADFYQAGAQHVVLIWAKYPNAPGWTSNLGQVEDQILRDNPPVHDNAMLIEVEGRA